MREFGASCSRRHAAFFEGTREEEEEMDSTKVLISIKPCVQMSLVKIAAVNQGPTGNNVRTMSVVKICTAADQGRSDMDTPLSLVRRTYQKEESQGRVCRDVTDQSRYWDPDHGMYTVAARGSSAANGSYSCLD